MVISDDLVQLRRKAIDSYRSYFAQLGLDEAAAHKLVLTCDTCSDAPTCEYAFDLYNTDGDCLASK